MKKTFRLSILILVSALVGVESEEVLSPVKVYQRFEQSIVKTGIIEKKGMLFVHVRGHDKRRGPSREYANQRLKALEKLSDYVRERAHSEITGKFDYKIHGIQIVSKRIEDGEVFLTVAVPMSEVRREIKRLRQLEK